MFQKLNNGSIKKHLHEQHLETQNCSIQIREFFSEFDQNFNLNRARHVLFFCWTFSFTIDFDFELLTKKRFFFFN